MCKCISDLTGKKAWGSYPTLKYLMEMMMTKYALVPNILCPGV